MKNSRVLIIGPSEVGSLPESYARALERLGMDVFRFNSERALFRATRFAKVRVIRRGLRPLLWWELNRATVEMAQTLRPILIIAFRASYLEAQTVADIQRAVGVPFINYYPDHPYCGLPLDPRKPSTLRRNLIEVLRQYTNVWIWERSLVRRLCSDGVRAAYLPFGVDPEMFQPAAAEARTGCAECQREHMIGFVGTYLPIRRQHLEAIGRHSVSVWGNGWPRQWQVGRFRHFAHGPVFGASVARIYAGCKVALNIIGDLNMPGHNMRTFEVPASGGVMLARYTPEQDELFPDGIAAAYYRSPQELDDKLEWLIRDAQIRARMRKEAVRLASEHTYDRRAQVLLDYYGLSDRARGPLDSGHIV